MPFNVLFDTNVISYWHRGAAEWGIPLLQLFEEIKKKKDYIYSVSVITIQELGVWAMNPNRPPGEWDKVDTFLKRFAKLKFDQRCAEKALHFEFKHGRPGRIKPKSANNEQTDSWNHDCAIIGTAVASNVNMIVTSEHKEWNKYADTLNKMAGCELRVLRPVTTFRGELPEGWQRMSSEELSKKLESQLELAAAKQSISPAASGNGNNLIKKELNQAEGENDTPLSPDSSAAENVAAKSASS